MSVVSRSCRFSVPVVSSGRSYRLQSGARALQRSPASTIFEAHLCWEDADTLQLTTDSGQQANDRQLATLFIP